MAFRNKTDFLFSKVDVKDHVKMNLKEPHVQIEASKVTYSQQTSASRCQRVAVTAHLSDDLNSGPAPTNQGVSTFTADHLTPNPPPSTFLCSTVDLLSRSSSILLTSF